MLGLSARGASFDKGTESMEPLDKAVDHFRGSPTGRLIVEYGDYECPSRVRPIVRSASRASAQRRDQVRVPPLPSDRDSPPRARGIGRRRGCFPSEIDSGRCTRCASIARRLSRTNICAATRNSSAWSRDVRSRSRERRSARANREGCPQRGRLGEVHGTPTLFIDGVVHRGGYDESSLLAALAG